MSKVKDNHLNSILDGFLSESILDLSSINQFIIGEFDEIKGNSPSIIPISYQDYTERLVDFLSPFLSGLIIASIVFLISAIALQELPLIFVKPADPEHINASNTVKLPANKARLEFKQHTIIAGKPG